MPGDMKTRDVKDLRQIKGLIRSIDQERRTVTGFATVDTRDRYGEVVEAKALKKDLKRFLRDDHLLSANHIYVNQDAEPTIIGIVKSASFEEIDINGETRKGLLCEFQFDDDELSEKWWQKYKKGIINSFSIGFIPKAWERKDYVDGDTTIENVWHYTDIELLEIAACPIPANRDAMVTNGLASGDPDEVEAFFKRLDESLAPVKAFIELNKDLQSATLEVKEGEGVNEQIQSLRKYVESFANQALRQLSVMVGGTAAAGQAHDCRKAQGGNVSSGVFKSAIFKGS